MWMKITEVMKREISNWSKYPTLSVEEILFTDRDIAKKVLKEKQELIARGNGRCYGDASLSSNVMSTLKYNKILGFDIEKGTFKCQSGVTLDDILDIIVPNGWFLPVTPGTKYITIGGAVSSDVHGKNHHVDGSFSNHIINIEILLANGEVVHCSPNTNEDLFHATCGGMGMTGLILSVEFYLKRIETAYINQKQIKAKNLEEILDLFQVYKDATYSMSWIDCLKKGNSFGRSILMVGEHAKKEEVKIKNPLLILKKNKLNVPFSLPSITLNKYSVRAFNFFYYNKNLKKEISNIIPYEPFFYPLDAILNWNRMYGKNGFVQYQFVLPLESSRQGLIDILTRISNKGIGSFLAVLKLFGKQDSLISFPMEGYTLALDIPIRKGLFEFLDELDKIVMNYGGRIYLSKDARMKKEVFLSTYPNIDKFKFIIKKYNSNSLFSSELSKRLTL